MGSVGQLIKKNEGPLWIWELPQPGASYVTGVDVAAGGEDGDFSVASVWKIPKTNREPYVQVAEYSTHIDPIAFAVPICTISKYYNESLLSIEANSYGLSTLIEAQKHYSNFYYWHYFDKPGGKVTKKIGFYTNRSTAPTIANLGSFLISIDAIQVRSKRLIDEMFKFARTNTGKGEGEAGFHDDHVYAFLIAIFCGETEYMGDTRIRVTEQTSDNVKIESIDNFTSDENLPPKKWRPGYNQPEEEHWLAL
jgi:hypothetical protein